MSQSLGIFHILNKISIPINKGIANLLVYYMVILISKKRLKVIIIGIISIITLMMSITLFKPTLWEREAYNSNIKHFLSQKITTESYSMFVPKTWKVKKFPNGTTVLTFYINDVKVGWLFKLGYIAYGNEYEILETRQLEGYKYEVQVTLLMREKPAAANDPTLTKEIHFYINDTKSTEVYDIAFYLDYVEESTAKEILKTFEIK